MHLGKHLRFLVAAGCATAALAVAPAAASALTNDYHPDVAVQQLNGGPNGWTSSREADGLCVPVLLCPVITNSFQASGGNPGGYLRTRLGALLGVGAVTRGIWTSPSFVYIGVRGLKPDKVTFTLHRRADVGALLAVAGNSATYTVRLLDLTSPGGNVTVIEDSPLAGAVSWTAVPGVTVNPNQLTIGHRYAIRITSEFVNGANVIPGGSADYDNIRLRADLSGIAGVTTRFISQFIRFGGGVAGRTFLSGNGKVLFVKTRCPKRAGIPCVNTLYAALSRRGPRVTLTRKVRVKNGSRKFVALRIRPAFRATVRNSSRLTVCARINVRALSVKACKRVKVVKPG